MNAGAAIGEGKLGLRGSGLVVGELMASPPIVR